MLAQRSPAQHELTQILYARYRKASKQKAIAMGGNTDLDRVVAYIPSEAKKELQEWADSEERSVSWIVAKLIDRALKEKRQQQNTTKAINLL